MVNQQIYPYQTSASIAAYGIQRFSFLKTIIKTRTFMSEIEPSHYKNDGIECIDVIKASMTDEQFRGFLKGNCIKYLFRAGNKANNPAEQDYGKAQWYLQKLL